MGEAQRAADQLHRAFHGDAWHGPSVCEVLNGLTASQAQLRPIANAHSIWELVLHIGAWAQIARRRIEGEQFEVTALDDWPAVGDTSERAWRDAQAQLHNRQEALKRTVSGLADERLNEILYGDRTVYMLVHGVVQHHLYHAGQIAILRKGLV
jgi:uncharacterized damage-inducible protein DinB